MNDPVLFSVAVYGMAIVISFLVAGLIRGIVVVLPMLARPTVKPGTVPATPQHNAIPPEHIAAITAAVAAVTTSRHIIHIEDRGRAAAWAAEGRMMHQTSHAVGHSPRQE